MDGGSIDTIRSGTKFERLVDFADGLPDIRQRVDADLRSRGLMLDKALATVVWMLDNLYIRIGNEALRRRQQVLWADPSRRLPILHIHPAVFEDFRAGRLRDVLGIHTRSERLLHWMDEEEIQVLRWLKRRPVPAL